MHERPFPRCPRSTLLAAATIFGTLILPAAQAEEARAEDSCELAKPLDGQRFLRRMSLDLRSRVPGYQEALAQSGRDEVPETIVDEFLASEDFIRTMRRYHAQLLWPNIDQVEVVPDTHLLYPFEAAPGVEVWLSPLRSVFARTISGMLYGTCKPEPATFDTRGNVIADPITNEAGEIVSYQEGYVEVEPWWAPGSFIKVCGFDAQPATTAEICPGPAERYPFLSPACDQLSRVAEQFQTPFLGQEAECNSRFAFFAPGCGCGPNLRYCQSAASLSTLRRSLLDQELRLVEDVVRNDRPYSDVILAKRIEVNGPIAHYVEHQSRLSFDTFADPDPASPMPTGLDPSAADRWTWVNRTGRHAGVLTAPGYLLRFQSNRGRAHRFYNAFECSSFTPNGALPSPLEPCSQELDLTKRCGCDACHKTLEPMAAHWGRFGEYGFAQIDETLYPEQLGTSCSPPFPNIERLLRCSRFYDVNDQSPNYLRLNAYGFRTESEKSSILAGPTLLAQSSIDSGRFGSCTVRKIWGQFMRRAPTIEEEGTVLPELTRAFEADGTKLRGLIKSIILQPAYRRLP